MCNTRVRRIVGMLVLAGAMAAPLALPAQAQPWRGGRDDRRYDNRGHYDRGPGPGAVIGGALLGLGVGALIGSRLAAPPPVVYAPPPQYAPPPPPVYYGY